MQKKNLNDEFKNLANSELKGEGEDDSPLLQEKPAKTPEEVKTMSLKNYKSPFSTPRPQPGLLDQINRLMVTRPTETKK
ncbi:MAG TPA: hypothetical protein VI959_02440 [Alphaproteobacteria bacterium]|nr:hypothetical protein [Alphaproteobacteria bacterium]